MGLVTILDPSVTAINARLAAVGYPGPLVTTGLYPNPVDTTNVIGKVDHQFSGRDQFSVRYSLYGANSSNSRGAGALSAPTASAGLDNIDQTVAFSNTMTLSDRTVNETRPRSPTAICLHRQIPSDPPSASPVSRRSARS
jgi:hypothetical protein